MIGIYQIKNNINGKMYIGKSIDIKSRWRNHISASKNPESPKYLYPLQQAFRKYGIENFTFTVLEECSEEELHEKEIHFYNIFQPEYCLTDPSQSPTQNAEIRKRISEGLKGRTLSKEHIDKLRQVNFGEKHHSIKPVMATNIKTKEVLYFNCYGEGAEYLIEHNLTTTNRRKAMQSISRVVNGHRNSFAGFIWEMQ